MHIAWTYQRMKYNKVMYVDIKFNSICRNLSDKTPYLSTFELLSREFCGYADGILQIMVLGGDENDLIISKNVLWRFGTKLCDRCR